jgi:hypothetical protein
MSSKIFNISREVTREVVLIKGQPTFKDTGEPVPDKKLKGYMSSVFNPNFHPPYESPITTKQ